MKSGSLHSQITQHAMNKTLSLDVGIMDTNRFHSTFIEFEFADLKYSSGSSTSKPILKAWTVWCIAALPQEGGVVGCVPCSKAVTDIGSVSLIDIQCTVLCL